MKRVLIIGGSIALAFGLGYWIYSQYKAVMNYCFNMGGYSLNSLSKDGIDLDVDLEIKNNSSINIQLLSYNLSVYLNGIKTAAITSPVNQTLKPHQFSTVVLKIKITGEDLSKFDLFSLTNILLDFKNTRIKIVGTLGVSIEGIKATGVPINIEQPLKDMLPASDQPKTVCV